MSYYPKFAKLLKQYLEERERSAAWLARRLGFHHGTVARWRNGESRPESPETIIRVADVLGVHDQFKRSELLVAAGYGYQPPASQPAPNTPLPRKESLKKERSSDSSKQEATNAPSVTQGETGAVGAKKGLPKSGVLPYEARLQPASYVQLVGVEEHLKRLTAVLVSKEAPYVLSIEGVGGVGKTSLADRLVRQIMREGLFDDLGWVSAKQESFTLGGTIKSLEEPALTVNGLVEALVSQLLGISATSFSTEQAFLALQKRLKERAHLIVIDNLETVLDIESLLPTLRRLTMPSKFLLTSRDSLYDEGNIYHFGVPELSESDALRLVRQEARVRNLPHLLSSSDEVLRRIYETVGGNPLALRLVVGQTHIHHLDVVLKELAEARGEKAENLYRYIYRRAWEQLDDLTRQVLLVMPLVTERGAGLDYIIQISELDALAVRKSLDLLVTLNLVDVRRDLEAWRYTIHNLTRTFLMEQVRKWL